MRAVAHPVATRVSPWCRCPRKSWLPLLFTCWSTSKYYDGPEQAAKSRRMGEERMRLTRPVPLLRRDVIDRRALLRLAAQAGIAFGIGSPAFAQQQPFKLGWIRPTTGRLASSFAPLYFGGLIAVDEINAAGG